MKLKSVWVLMFALAMGLSGLAYAEPWDYEKPNEITEERAVEAVVDRAVDKTEAVEFKKVEAPKTAEPKVVASKAAAAAPAADEAAARALKGIENQKAWIATLEKQLDGEKAKLVKMEADAGKSGKKR